MKRRVAIVIELEWPLKHHYEVFAGTQRYADEHDWECTVWPHLPRSPDLRGTYDGIIARVTPELAEQVHRAGIPLVNTWSSSPVRDVPTVCADGRHGGRLAAEHLLSRGFVRFAFLGYRRVRDSRDWQDGFHATIEAAGHDCRVHNVSHNLWAGPQNWERFLEEIDGWVTALEPPIAVCTGSDFLARYLAKEVKIRGLRIPEDFAIVGSGNESVICLKPEPSLSSVEIGYERVGYVAAELLDVLMRGGPPPAAPVMIPPVTVVPRHSSEGFAVKDPIVQNALRFIMEHRSEAIKVRDVVANVHASGRSLERHFLKVRGCTMAEEIARLRHERVKRLLLESELPVKEVAAVSGFSSASQLCQSFRRMEGMSPGTYRERHAERRGCE